MTPDSLDPELTQDEVDVIKVLQNVLNSRSNWKFEKEFTDGKSPTRVLLYSTSDDISPIATIRRIVKMGPRRVIVDEIERYIKFSQGFNFENFVKITKPQETIKAFEKHLGETVGLIYQYAAQTIPTNKEPQSLEELSRKTLIDPSLVDSLLSCIEKVMFTLESLNEVENLGAPELLYSYKERWLPDYSSSVSEIFSSENHPGYLLTDRKIGFDEFINLDEPKSTDLFLKNQIITWISKDGSKISISPASESERKFKTIYTHLFMGVLNDLKVGDIVHVLTCSKIKRFDAYKNLLSREATQREVDLLNCDQFFFRDNLIVNPLKEEKFFTGIFKILKQSVRTGYVHGDLHAGNILVTEEIPILIDYGLSEEDNLIGADWARLVGSLIRNVISKSLRPGDLFLLLLNTIRDASSPPEKPSSEQEISTAILSEALKFKNKFISGGDNGYLYHLFGFALVGIKWDCEDERCRKACFFLAAVCITVLLGVKDEDDKLDSLVKIYSGVSRNPPTHAESVAFVNAKVCNPEFQHKVQLKGDPSVVYSASEIIRKTELKAVVNSPGGMGKSAFLLSVLKTSFKMNKFLLDLKHDSYEDSCFPIKKDPLDGFWVLGCTASLINSLQSFPSQTLLLVDGLNERRGFSRYVCELLSLIAKKFPKAKILVADRMIGRSQLKDFLELEISPLDVSLVRHYVPSLKNLEDSNTSLQLLRSPFFLDLKIQNESANQESREELPIERKDLLLKYFQRFDVFPLDLKHLLQCACDAYKVNKSRIFSSHQFEKWFDIKSSMFTQLNEGDKYMFYHQLLHDFLAGAFVAKNPDKWRPELFDDVTFDAQSNESLSFALELTDKRDSDRLLLEIYDWNYYAALNCLRDQFILLHRPNMSQDLAFSIVTMIAEKIYDPFTGTVEIVRKNIKDLPEAFRSYQSVESIEGIRSIVQSYEPKNDGWTEFEKWRNLYLRDIGTPPRNLEHRLFDESPVLGWTAANVFRRAPYSKDFCELVVVKLETVTINPKYLQVNPNHRWRLIHFLGAFPDPRTTEALLWSLKNDPYKWARYGAARGLLEHASKSKDNRCEILNSLKDLIVSRSLGYFEILAIGKRLNLDIDDDDWFNNDIQGIMSAIDEALTNTASELEWQAVKKKLKGGAIG